MNKGVDFFLKNRSPDKGSQQFNHLQTLVFEAVQVIGTLRKAYPHHSHIWDMVSDKIKIIQNTVNTGILPTQKMKQDAHMGPMLSKGCDDLVGVAELNKLYELDNAYQLMGIKPFTPDEIEQFLKEVNKI